VHAAEIAIRDLESGERMLLEVLDVARLQGGRLTLSVSPFDVRLWLAEAVESHAAAAAARHIRVHVVCSRGVPARLLGDSSRLQHVLRSFLSDSTDVTAAGSEIIVHCAMEQPQRSGVSTHGLGTVAGAPASALTTTAQPAAAKAAAALPESATSSRDDGHSAQPASCGTSPKESREVASSRSRLSGLASPARKQTLPHATALPLPSAVSSAEAPVGSLLGTEPTHNHQATAVLPGEPRLQHSDAGSPVNSPAPQPSGGSMFSFPPSTEYTSRIVGRPSRIVPDPSADASLAAHAAVRQGSLLLRVSVQRRGALLSSEQLRTAFDAYVHVPSESGAGQNAASADVGSELSTEGFGLRYAREVVQLCGGSVGASNVVGLGTALWFQVPLLPAPPVDDPSVATSGGDAVSALFSVVALVSHASASAGPESPEPAPTSASGRRPVSDSGAGDGILITTSDQTAERVRRHSPPPMQSAFDAAVALRQHAAGPARRLSSTSASRLLTLHAPPVAAMSPGVRRSSLKAVGSGTSLAHQQGTPPLPLGDSATPTAVAIAVSARDAASALPA
jgi:hypothetical protein